MPASFSDIRAGLLPRLWRGRQHFGRGLVRELLEVLAEEPRQVPRLLVVGRLVRPGLTRDQYRTRHSGSVGRDLEPEDWILDVAGLVELAVQRGVEERARVLDRHAPADAVRTAGEPGIHQPDAGAVLGDVLPEQLAVHRRMQRHEGSAEAGGERGLGLFHPDLGACDLRRIAGEEVIRRLCEPQPLYPR